MNGVIFNMRKEIIGIDSFKTLISVLQRIENTMSGLEKLFDFNMDSGDLANAWEDLTNEIENLCELNIDRKDGSVLRQFMFEGQFGKQPLTKTLYGTTYLIEDVVSLYIYLSAKWSYDIKIIEENKYEDTFGN